MRRIVPSAERIYVDPSALRSMYLHDDRSPRFCSWRKRVGGSLPITRFGRAELVNSLHLAVHRGLVEAGDAAVAAGDLDADLQEGRLTLVDALWRRTLDLTAVLSAQHTARVGTRSLDVLHIASALVLEMTWFASYDDRQLELARRTGLKTLSP
jgi:hypothetical protein